MPLLDPGSAARKILHDLRYRPYVSSPMIRLLHALELEADAAGAPQTCVQRLSQEAKMLYDLQHQYTCKCGHSAGSHEQDPETGELTGRCIHGPPGDCHHCGKQIPGDECHCQAFAPRTAEGLIAQHRKGDWFGEAPAYPVEPPDDDDDDDEEEADD